MSALRVFAIGLNMKKAYKELQANLKNSYSMELGRTEHGYNIMKALHDWVEYCNMKSSDDHITVICRIFDMVVPFPYMKKDRKKILKYLKKNTYKQFKKDKF